MAKEKPNMTNKIIIPKKKGSSLLEEEAQKKLLEDLQNITPEDIDEIANETEKN